MLRLTTFGGLTVENERGVLASATAHRRRIALLPLLAAARGRGVSRDKAIAYLWPESDSDRARHALTQTLYALRLSLGEEVVQADVMELRLNPVAISSDLGEFEEAFERGDFERAAAVYRGPFLDGFHLKEAPEFERWMDAEQRRLAARARRAFEELAHDASRRGDDLAAADWWRRLAALDPLSSRAAVGLMSALERIGDRGGALQHARVHEALLRQELDAAPDPAVSALAARIRLDTVVTTGKEQVTPSPSATVHGGTSSRTDHPGTPPGIRQEPPPGDMSSPYHVRLHHALSERYTLMREVERNWAATTFLARDLQHDDLVTLRIIEPMLVAHMDVASFLQTMHHVQTLTHPHIVQLRDASEAAGIVYCAMSQVDGETLRARLRREKQLAIDEALRIACALADALGYAHAHHLVHRDVKPRNIVVSGGTALLASFGVSAAIAAAAAASTPSGVTLGSPMYMSPEHFAGDPQLDGRSDLYSLGCVLYEMLAGTPPFAGQTPQVIVALRLTAAAPKLRTLRDSVSARVESAVAKVLARVPADRFQTAAAFRDALGEC